MAKAGVVQQAGKRGAHVDAIAERVIARPELIVELLEALKVEKGTAKYGYEKVLRLVSERRPELVYPYFDVFVGLLDSDNCFLKWGAIMTIANLTTVDAAGRFKAIFAKYYAPTRGPVMITAANIIGSSACIVPAKPGLVASITREILRVEKANYARDGAPSPECRNVAIGHAMDAFDRFFDRVQDKDAVVRFVKRQLKNTRTPVVKKAEQFLRRHGLVADEQGSGSRSRAKHG